ncbi:hypothetical protein M758_12G001800 [Ceratodon purpureus]|uniref:RCK N-terminal domain-containing protein n=1 Tax=Ceratodon purpureus TaxID=3225 RepID=A0A8T0G359_CERPU|nr:hypothetical protein KC19_12G003800 [Ceratodon purpureus]KAG0597524.1 hypothetical protein M758_12G001800 [Ceratodon purpureus]
MAVDPDLALKNEEDVEPSQPSSDVENGAPHHTVILGWSNKIPSLVRQLTVANQQQSGSMGRAGEITVVAAMELEQMQAEFKSHNIDMLGTNLTMICGSRHDTQILRKAGVDAAHAVIVLTESQDAEESDELAVILVKKILKAMDATNFKGYIVVEVNDVEDEVWVKEAGGGLVETVVAKDVIRRLMVQCARQPGLAQVWKDILGFDKAEFFIRRWAELDGMRFVDVLISFPDAIPCGVKVAARNGKIVLNPDDEYILAEGDEVLVIADDHDSYAPSTSLPEVRLFCKLRSPKEVQEAKAVKKILFCGWQRDMEDMIPLLEGSLGEGSELWIFSEVAEEERARRLREKGVAVESLQNVTVTECTGKATRKKDLESLPLELFDSILLVADGDTDSFIAKQEQGPLSTLIMIKSIQTKRMPYREARAVQMRPAGKSKSMWIDELKHSPAQSIIVSDILNEQTLRAIGEAVDSKDIVISDEMVSMALAMVAEDRCISGVLDELFAEEGNEMFMRPAENYLDEDAEELSFFDIMVRARQRREIVIGYHQVFKDNPAINPRDKAVKKKWSLDVSFIVLVERP